MLKCGVVKTNKGESINNNVELLNYYSNLVGLNNYYLRLKIICIDWDTQTK